MTAEGRQRIDKWLFFARVVKSRSLAARLAQAGRVRVNRNKIDQASHMVRPGDVLTITLDRRILIYRILDAGERRGPATEARLLFEDLTPPAPPAADPALQPLRERGAGRPTKKERRALDDWKGEE
ncbi:RNA-binding S4 domain-containing protein [Chelativorans salis]|uniref:RNA-binding S4 domain-containing protein n=1 Tax=Chelativorans salis TaxID=2978478 RepID=A0ABT2LQ26_9HYPH|nr:RNA-binding S4 domain-containing protein [Chelativorans sp. EGI FJ00035]MCT7376592.1 RNA-binding S4 domain-containing protein [Chelativorans sp. EGI FJ00035]